MPRYDDDRHVGIVPLDRLENIDTIHPAVFQPDIQDHQRWRFRVYGGDCIIRIASQPSGKAFVL